MSKIVSLDRIKQGIALTGDNKIASRWNKQTWRKNYTLLMA